MKATTILLVLTLSGCALRDDEGDTHNGRRRGLSILQFGLVNVSSNNAITAPEPRDTTRLMIDQRMRFDRLEK